MWCVVLGVACFPCVLFMVLVADCLGRCWLLVWAYACLEFCYLVFIWVKICWFLLLLSVLIEAVFGVWGDWCCVALVCLALLWVAMVALRELLFLVAVWWFVWLFILRLSCVLVVLVMWWFMCICWLFILLIVYYCWFAWGTLAFCLGCEFVCLWI